MPVPAIRIRALDQAPVNAEGELVLYWMVAARRTHHSYALDRALEWARELGLPLVVFEPLRVGYPHASDRFHQFVIDGMGDQAARCEAAGVTYLPYLEPTPGAGRGLLEALAERAAVVVTDDYPSFFLPRMLEAASGRVGVRMEAVDGNGLIPLRLPDKEHVTARGFRRWSQGVLPTELARPPRPDPFEERLDAAWTPPASIRERWAFGRDADLASLPVDHGVAATERGGAEAGRARWRRFVDEGLARYAKDGNHPDEDAVSGISPWLHWGQLGAHELFDDVAAHAGWSLGDQAEKPNGKREGWWRMSDSAESFLEQLACWRELSYATAAWRPDHGSYAVLPAWAQKTLAEHADDPRPHLYSLAELEAAETHDRVWNAAQRQLVEEGRIHNYLRMLWGKKILEWSPSPREALARMIHLNDRWALDGRDPNSYSGITWVLGHFDRAWGPERPIYGKIRYMSSDNTVRKLRIRRYLARWVGEIPTS
ncbi:MAG: deoxyribodipyrimidine photolyase [Sandaracinaceae bacterium]